MFCSWKYFFAYSDVQTASFMTWCQYTYCMIHVLWLLLYIKSNVDVPWCKINCSCAWSLLELSQKESVFNYSLVGFCWIYNSSGRCTGEVSEVMMLFKGLVLWPCRCCAAWLSSLLQWEFKGGTRTCWEDDEISKWSWRNYHSATNWGKL